MADPAFHSKFRADIEAFIIQKRASGYPYNTSARVLGYLDAMISKSFPDSDILSKEICNAWIDKCSSFHQNTLLRRVTPVRQFAKYLVGTGKEAYIIPGGIPNKQIHYDAHIFTETELKAFFSSIDKCRKSPFSPYRCYVIPVIFRLLYTCGLRASEARLLNVDDVDLGTGKIFIRGSKGWEARIIYVSLDMLDLLCRYDCIIQRYLPARKAFFSSIDKCRKSPFSPYRCYVIPVIFRLLYTCGLRASEARLLNVDDVDLDTGKIFIRGSKGWEARIIYVSPDMLDLLHRYDCIIQRYLPARKVFFPNQKGDFYSKSTLDIWFHEFWDTLPEAAVTKGNKPRVHDFRHSYCVYRLNQWVSDNADLNALYPYLSEFVGHSNFADTDYYLTLAEPFYSEFEARMRKVNAAILPEVPHGD